MILLIVFTEGDPDYLQLANQGLTIFGSIASIIGLIITWFIWKGVNRLKDAFVAKVAAPIRIEKLERIRTECRELLNGSFNIDNKNRMTELFIEARTNAQNLSPKIKRMNKRDYKNHIKPKLIMFEQDHDTYQKQKNKKSAQKALNTLYELIKASEMLIEDANLRQTE